MLFRKHNVSTRTLLQLAVAIVFSVAAVGAAFAANNSGVAPLLVPYTIQTIAGTPQFVGNTTSVASGYLGEGVPATTSLAHQTGAAVMNNPTSVAVDSVGNVYIVDTGNFIIREVNAQTGLINTIAGVIPKGCTGFACTLRSSGCSDGVPAFGNPIGSKIQGIAVDSYGNVFFSDSTTVSVSVVYRGGTQIANFINLVNPAGVAASGGTVKPGYVYHVAGAVNLSNCSPTKGAVDDGLAWTDTTSGATPTAEFGSQSQQFLVTLDSADNIYIGDTGNATTRVINTQATPQTFFQYTIPPGTMRSVTDCNALLTVPCPTAPTSIIANTGIFGPANAVVYSSQFKLSQADAYGNIYQLNGTGGGTAPPGIYANTIYAGGAPLTNLIQVEAPMYADTFGPNSATPGNTPAELNAAGLPTYGYAFDTVGNESIKSNLVLSIDLLVPLDGSGFDIRPNGMLPDNFGTIWFGDNHYPFLARIDQYTSLESIMLKTGRATNNISPLNVNPASFDNPYYCVYGSTSGKIAWTQGPQTFDPRGDGCPSVVATFGGGYFNTVSDGLANIYVSDPGLQLTRELVNGNSFAPLAVGTTAPVTQAIQVHFNATNPPVITGDTVNAGSATANTTTTFSIAPGIPDFTINTTTPEFPMGSLINGNNSAYANSTTTTNFQMWAGLPTCTQLGAFPKATGVQDYDCLVYVTFNPTAPGVRQSQLVATTANGSIYNFGLFGVGTGGQLAIDGGTATPVAATGLGGASGNGPSAVAVNSAGTVYIADPANNRIVVKPAGSGTQTNLTFTGVTPATFSGPMGVALDTAGNIYVSDTGNNRILKIDAATNVAAVLGNYVWVPGAICSGTNPAPTCPATNPSTVTATTAPPQYSFNHPQGLAVDALNNVYVADTGNKVVVEISSNIQMGAATPLLSYPGAPTFTKPVAVAVDSQGNIYVADNQVAGAVVVILPPGGGDLVSVPGSSFPKTAAANLLSPNGVAVDAAGNIYVSDNSLNQIYEIPSASGAVGNPFLLNFPTVSSPAGLALDSNGNLYVADSGNNQILFDNRQSPLVNFGTVSQNLASPSGLAGYIGTPPTPAACPIAGDSTVCTGVLTVTNIGNSPVTLTSPLTTVTSAPNPAYAISNNCGTAVGTGATCTIAPTFNPTVDNLQSETVSVNGGTQTLSLVANGQQPLAKIVLSASYSTGTTPTTGATATITATVTQPFISGNTPTGTVTFTYTIDANNTNVNSCGTGGTQTVTMVGGVASFQLPVLAQGVQYTVNATYAGDTFSSFTKASKLDIFVPGIPVTSTVTSTAAQLTYTYGQTPPAITGTVTPTPASPVTFTFGSSATASTPITLSPYPVVVTFHGAGSCAYGFPVSNFAAGGPAVVTEKPAPLSYTLPNFTSLYGALALSYGAGISPVGGVNGDTFSATFTPPDSSILNVGIYTVTATVTGHNAGNYTVAPSTSTLTITLAPVAIGVSAAKTAVVNTAAGLASATFGISVGTTVPSGKGVPSGTVTVTDVFTPITATGYGTAQAPTTSVVTLVAGFGTYVPTSTTPGLHQYSFAYSGDSNFQTATLVPSTIPPFCTAETPTSNCLVVDNPDFTLTSRTGPIVIIPGVIPSGNGLPVAPNQSTAAPETAVMFINAVLGFTGSVDLSCTTQNPSYVTCFMTPTTVCFATSSSPSCTNTSAIAASVLAVETPATLPLGFFSQTRTSPTKTMLAFLPFGVLAFCVRRRRRLSKALWILIAVAAISAGMSGCGGNQVAFYSPIPTGPQTVTVTATYLGNGGNQPAATRSLTVPIAID